VGVLFPSGYECGVGKSQNLTLGIPMYITGSSVFLLAVFYFPLVIWGLCKLWPRLPKQLSIRIPATMVVFLLLAAIPLWDVTLTTVKMAELCPQTGVFVKRSVQVDGFYGDTHTAMLDGGFSYIEQRRDRGRVFVYNKDGESIKKLEFEAGAYQIKSRYEYIESIAKFEGRRDIEIQKSVIRDRTTNEELGYALGYHAFPGWLDRNTISLLGLIMWRCPDDQLIHLRMRNTVFLPKSK
jgi:hypothetical protein